MSFRGGLLASVVVPPWLAMKIRLVPSRDCSSIVYLAPETSTDTWSNCEPGTLRRLAMERRRCASRRLLVKRSAAASGVVGSFALAMLLLGFLNRVQPTGSQQPVGISRPAIAAQLHCPEVFDLREAFLLGNLSDTERQRVAAHLGLCQHCLELYRQRAQELNVEMFSRKKPAAVETARSLLAAR